MSGAKKCEYCDLFYDETLRSCPYCGSPNGQPAGQANVFSPEYGRERTPTRPAPAGNIRNPWIAALWSLIFLGCGHWYLGRRDEGLKFLFAYFAVYIVMFILVPFAFISIIFAIGLVVAGMIAGYCIWLYAAYDAYRTAQKINRGELEFVRKSRLFWIPTALFVMIILLSGLVFALKAAGFGPSADTGPAAVPTITPVPVATWTGSVTETTPLYEEKFTPISSLMATRYDLPADFAEPRFRLIEDSEIDANMRRLGAVTGYRGYYPKNPISDESLWVGHFVIPFPDRKSREMVDADIAVYDSLKPGVKNGLFDCSSIGDHCIAYRTVARNPGDTEDHYHIIMSFSKGDIYEKLWTVGPDPDYDTVKGIAENLAAKVP